MYKFLIFLIAVFFLVTFSFALQKFPQVNQVRYWTAPDHTRVVLDLSEPVSYNSFELENPKRFVLDLSNSSLNQKNYPKKSTEVLVQDDLINKVRLAQFDPKTVRVVLDLTKDTIKDFKVFLLSKYLDRPDRLVIDVFPPSEILAKQQDNIREEINRLKDQKTHIVVIDPGHGGEDTGAIGKRGTREKDIVLSIAKKMKEFLDKKDTLRAFLTRSSDYYIPLAQRVQKARQLQGDLFISLHCNSAPRRSAYGGSVYCLSLKGASSKAAQILADKENAADFIGGVIHAKADGLESILLDLVQTHTLNESILLGELSLGYMKKVNPLEHNALRRANFAVLKAPDMPSILVEIAFLSNDNEEAKLCKKSFQSQIAQELANCCENFIKTRVAKY